MGPVLPKSSAICRTHVRWIDARLTPVHNGQAVWNVVAVRTGGVGSAADLTRVFDDSAAPYSTTIFLAVVRRDIITCAALVSGGQAIWLAGTVRARTSVTTTHAAGVVQNPPTPDALAVLRAGVGGRIGNAHVALIEIAWPVLKYMQTCSRSLSGQ